MSGDGVSLQTNLVQLGNVAKATARATHGVPALDPAHEPDDRSEAARLRRVTEAEKAERQQVDAERRGRRDPRDEQPDDAAARAPDAPAAEAPPEDDAAAPGVGGLVDTKA